MQTTGNAGGSHNLQILSDETKRADDFEGMLRKMGTGLLVTELMGQGVNYVTGDYSRGASGYWVENGVIHSVRIGAGGVAAVPARATKTEAALAGQQCAEGAFDAAASVLEAEFKPLSDMRASSAYRRAVLGNLLRRGWQQSQPGALALADLTMEPLP